MQCGSCSESLPPENDYVTCGGCKCSFHYACANVRETAWRKFSADVKLSWKCVICRTKTVSADSVKTDVNTGDGVSLNKNDKSVNIANDPVINGNKTIPATFRVSEENKFDEVGYLKELLRHKDMLIANQVDLIESLKEQINLLKLNRAPAAVFSGGTAGGGRLGASADQLKSKASKSASSKVQNKVILDIDPDKKKPEKRVETGTAIHDKVIKSKDGCDGVSNYDVHEALTRAKMHDIITLAGDSNTDDVWKKVKTRRSNKPVIGKRPSENCKLRAAESYSHWHVYRLHPETGVKDIEAHLTLNDFCDVKIEKLNSVDPTLYSSFKVSVREGDKQKILDEGLWPGGTRINRFFLPRTRQS